MEVRGRGGSSENRSSERAGHTRREHQTEREERAAGDEECTCAERVEQSPRDQSLCVNCARSADVLSINALHCTHPRKEEEQLHRANPRNIVRRPMLELIALVMPLEHSERVRQAELRKARELRSASFHI